MSNEPIVEQERTDIPASNGEAGGAGEPGSAGAKRRRRRRRGRGGSGAGEGQAGSTDHAISEARPDAPVAETTGARERQANGGGGSRRDDRGGGRRGRGGGGGGGGRGGQRGRGSGDRGERRYDDDGPGEAPAPRPPRKRRVVEPGEVEHWDEIFGGQTFADLGLRNSVLKGLDDLGFKHPTKIQADMIPMVMAGKDVLGQSRTGTGKTAAFGLPLFHLAVRDVPFQSLILAPTRELAIQIAAELSDLGKHTPIRVSAVYGGQHVGQQARELDKGPEIIVATPGRLMDMVERGHIHLQNVKFAVLDEVDRMLDIGFRDDIKRILGSIKSEHVTVFVSATISEEIERLARSYMRNPEKIVTTGGSLTVSLVEQHYIAVEAWDKKAMLQHVLTHEEPDLTVIFCRMKRTVDDVAKFLRVKGIDAHAIHGDMYQGKRNSVMNRLRSGELGVLVASDLAARGLDVDDISHVINYDLPDDPEVYIHRIGRTARAGRRGVAWSLVTPEQGGLLTDIEKLANTHIPEKTYPDFKPGPAPADVEQQRRREAERITALRSVNRLSASASLPVSREAAVVDTSKFPGGLVPTKLPPKMMGGRVKTARSMKQAVSESHKKDAQAG